MSTIPERKQLLDSAFVDARAVTSFLPGVTINDAKALYYAGDKAAELAEKLHALGSAAEEAAAASTSTDAVEA